MPLDHLMKYKTASGFDVLYPITKPDNVKTVEPIEVMLPAGSKVGSFQNGDVINADTSVQSILKKMLQVQVPPTYSAPSVSLAASGNSAGKYEVGTSLTPTLTSTFTKRDAGNILTHQITKNGTQVALNSATPLTHSETFVLDDSAVTFKSTCSYEAGAVKNDNFGDPYPTGSIAAGQVSSSNVTYTPFRAYFYGADTVATAPATSSEVRALESKSNAAAAAGTSLTINIAAGDKRVVIAYPASIRDINKVLYVEAGNDDYTAMIGTPTTVSVEGANGATAIDYKVYSWIPAQPFPSAMTLKVTI